MERVDRSSSRKTLQRYLALQIPGAVLVGLLLVAFYYAGFVSLLLAAGLFVGWCVKDAIMYRVVRSAYEPGPPHGTAALVGQAGVVVDDLAPTGSVRLGAERWSARPAQRNSSLARGTRIRVVSVDGYVVTVEAEGEASARP